jgi:hypothetical protein
MQQIKVIIIIIIIIVYFVLYKKGVKMVFDNKLKDIGRWITDKPQVGDLCFMDFPHDGIDRISHIGIVVKAGATSVICVEGNTSGTGDQRNGGMVMIKRRNIGKEIVGFGRPKLVAYSGELPAVEIPDEAPKKGNKKK